MRRLIHGMLRKLMLIGSNYLGTLKCFSGVLAPNGNIYFAPQFREKKIKEFNPVTNVINHIDIPVITGDSTSMYYGGVLAPNGNIYFAPRNINQIGKLSGVNSPNVLSTNMLIPANLADLPTSNYNMYYNKF